MNTVSKPMTRNQKNTPGPNVPWSIPRRPKFPSCPPASFPTIARKVAASKAAVTTLWIAVGHGTGWRAHC
ncbi:Uncharacterised protein [Mycobacteroides abscessus subsp. abscessus]|nr:Uncharacterised protein [Mycobacteroides abscessus subsp. abscessus]